MIDVTFADRTILVDPRVAQALFDDGTIERIRTDSGDCFVGADVALTLFNNGLLHEDNGGQCGRGWLGIKGQCKRKGSAGPQAAGMTRGQKIRRIAKIAGGVALVGAAAYGASRASRYNSSGARNVSSASKTKSPEKYASQPVPPGQKGGPLALSSKGSGQMARTAQVKKEIKKSMFQTRAERKLANAARGKQNTETYFSAKSGTGKGRLSQTIGGIPVETSVREGRRIKKRPQWLTPGYKKGKGN